jgi:hypothetical protein
VIETSEDTCRHIIQVYPAELGYHGLKIALLKLLTNSKLSISEHKQNELKNASTSTHIETSSSTDMDYDVTKISQLQSDKHGQIVPTRTPPPTMTSKSTIDHPSSPSDNDYKVQNDNLLSFEFWLPV